MAYPRVKIANPSMERYMNGETISPYLHAAANMRPHKHSVSALLLEERPSIELDESVDQEKLDLQGRM